MSEHSAEDIDVVIDENPVQRTPCVLVLDTSGSMATDGRIAQLNQALQIFEKTIKANETLRQQLILSVIGFGSQVDILCDWTQGDEFRPHNWSPRARPAWARLCERHTKRWKISGEAQGQRRALHPAMDLPDVRRRAHRRLAGSRRRVAGAL